MTLFLRGMGEGQEQFGRGKPTKTVILRASPTERRRNYNVYRVTNIDKIRRPPRTR